MWCCAVVQLEPGQRTGEPLRGALKISILNFDRIASILGRMHKQSVVVGRTRLFGVQSIIQLWAEGPGAYV